MGHILAQVRLARLSGLPEDVVVNTFHFTTLGPIGASEIEAVRAALANMYGGSAGLFGNLGSFMPAALMDATPAGHVIKMYDFDTAVPRVPIHTSTFAMAFTGTGPLPAEVALCGSFSALSPGANPRRRKGRVYLGPFATSVLGTTSTGDARPSNGIKEAILDALDKITFTLAAGVPTLAVWSSVDQVLAPVTSLWVDDAFDTQRSRGAKPTSRSSRPVPQ
jgi:hypothetical protein